MKVGQRGEKDIVESVAAHQCLTFMIKDSVWRTALPCLPDTCPKPGAVMVLPECPSNIVKGMQAAVQGTI